jgi:hypothetical protein
MGRGSSGQGQYGRDEDDIDRRHGWNDDDWDYQSRGHSDQDEDYGDEEDFSHRSESDYDESDSDYEARERRGGYNEDDDRPYRSSSQSGRGFASWDPESRREAASRGGRSRSGQRRR